MTQENVKRANRSKKMLWYALKRKRKQWRVLSNTRKRRRAEAL